MNYTLTNDVIWLPNQGWDSRIHIAVNGDLVNVFLLVTERYLLLVDTLLNPVTANALVEYARPYLSSRQLLVINTHSDWDHAWGNQLFAGSNALYPAPIIAHELARRELFHPDNVELLKSARVDRPDIFGPGPLGEIIITAPTLTFSHELWIDGGDLTVHLFSTPGHRDDHIALFIPEISTLLAGDAAEVPFPMIQNSADFPKLRASLTAMVELEAREVLYCHAPPAAGPQLIKDNIAYFDGLEAACRLALANGFDPNGVSAQDLPSAIGCELVSIMPTSGVWQEVAPGDYAEQHAEMLQYMMEWVLQSGESTR